MKNKKLIMAISLVVALGLLVGTAFAAQPANQGYEAFKELMKNNKEAKFENGTMTGMLHLTDNGQTIAQMTGVLKGTKDEKQVSGNISIIAGDLNKTLELYGLDNVMYIFDNKAGQYYQANKPEHEKFREEFSNNENINHNMTSEEEALFDFFVGDLKDNFIQVINKDGSSSIEFELTKDEIPVPLNLIASVAAKNQGKFEHIKEAKGAELEQYPLYNDMKAMEAKMPELVEDVQLEYVKAVAELDKNGEVYAMSFAVVQTGKDAAGVYHELGAQGRFELSNLNTTTIDMPQLEGKNIQVLPEFSREGM